MGSQPLVLFAASGDWVENRSGMARVPGVGKAVAGTINQMVKARLTRLLVTPRTFRALPKIEPWTARGEDALDWMRRFPV